MTTTPSGLERPPLARAAAGEEVEAQARIGPGGWYGLAVLIVISLVATVDKQIFGLVAEPMRLSLKLNDTQLGLLQGIGGILITSAAAFPLGWLADRYDRRWVLAGSALFWSAASAWRGLAGGFAGLFAATLALSGGEAGLVPATYGLIPAIIPKSRRVLANGVYVVALYLAANAGLALCGDLVSWLDRSHDSLPPLLRGMETWRTAYVVLALPGPIAALLLFTIPLRHRGAPGAPVRATPEPEPGAVGLLAYINRNRAAVAGVAGGSGVIAIGAAVRLWSPIIAVRIFHATPGEAGNGLGLAGGVGWVVGFLATIAITRAVAQRLGTRFPPRVLWVGALASGLVSAAMLLARDASQFYMLVGVQAAIETAGSIVSPTLLQDLAPSHLRSRMISLCVVIAMGINALMPILVGMISDALAPAPNALMVAAVAVGVAGTFGASLIFALAETPYKRTADAVA